MSKHRYGLYINNLQWDYFGRLQWEPSGARCALVPVTYRVPGLPDLLCPKCDPVGYAGRAARHR